MLRIVTHRLAGAMLPPRFRNASKRGEGTFGKVYLCRDRAADRSVAVKCFRDSASDEWMGWSPDTVRELAYLRHATRHKCILALDEVIVQDVRICAVLPPMEGSVYQRIKEGGILSESHVQTMFADIVTGIHCLHKDSVMHRDLKLQNVLVDGDGRCKIGDLGTLRYFRSGRSYTLEVCTPQFRALEILLGDSRYGPSSDVWSLGCMLYELCTGKMLFAGDGTCVDQLRVIAQTIGKATPESWPGVDALPY